MSKINPNGKQLLLTLNASEAIKHESFLFDGPRTNDMIGCNWIAEKIYLAHQEVGSQSSRHTLEKTGTILDVIENDEQIIIQVY